MAILLALGYILPVLGILAVVVLSAAIVGLSGYTLYEWLQERRVAAGEVVRVRV